MQHKTLGAPPSVGLARLYALNDPIPLAKLLNLVVQAHDVQPGHSLSYGQLDYGLLTEWLDLSLALDPQGQYPMLAGARLYTQASADAQRQRKMTDWVASRFHHDPARRWQWMAHVAYVAKVQLNDIDLALRYAEQLRLGTQAIPTVPAWARQLEIFFHLNLSQTDTAKLLLRQLLDSGQIKDDNEWRFLKHTLDSLEQKQSAQGQSAQGTR